MSLMASSPAGALLREWRATRRMSQLDLALEAGVSTRHLSCVETGKSQPSREMIARLAGALTMPLRDLNALLIAAGYAPGYPETALRKPELAQIRGAIDLILKHQEPYPAFLLDRHWDILETNRAAVAMSGFLIGGSAHSNMMLQFFDPDDLRRVVAKVGNSIAAVTKEIELKKPLPSAAAAPVEIDAGLPPEIGITASV